MIVNPKEPQYWDEQNLTKELHRVYDICHQCRLCFNLCPSFSELFHFIDEKDGEVKALSRVELNHVTDLCYQCKLCFVKCPYTPPHQWHVDFPRLLLRDKAVRVKKEGSKIEDRFLGDPDRNGKKGCSMAPLANWVNHNSLARKLMAATLGIHEQRNLPDFQPTTFEEWFRKRQQPLKSEKKVAFFHTCFVNYYAVNQGIAAVEVLEKNGFEVVVPKQVCCGMPFLDGGEIDKATKNMEENVRYFKPVIDSNLPILSVGPTCSYVLKNEFPYFTQHPAAQQMADQTKDICEFLVELKSKKELNTDFKNTPSIRIAYQIPCHLRAQNMGYKSMELLRLIPNVEIHLIEQCSAMDGTWGFKKENFELSLKVANKLFREVDQSASQEVCTDCPLSAVQIEYGTNKKPMHPVQVLHRAYDL
ncbi:MAG TPA: anaerobic glycerol-3-phosphate dehydrogenase subunit C [Acidobacteriota bacterium]